MYDVAWPGDTTYRSTSGTHDTRGQRRVVEHELNGLPAAPSQSMQPRVDD
jgi:hypothetical protein